MELLATQSLLRRFCLASRRRNDVDILGLTTSEGQGMATRTSFFVTRVMNHVIVTVADGSWNSY